MSVDLYGPGYVVSPSSGNEALLAMIRNLGQLIDNLTAGQYAPADDSVTDAKVPAGAAIAQSKIAGLVADLAARATDAELTALDVAVTAALALKAPSTGIAQASITNLVNDLAAKATPAQITAAIAALSGTYAGTPNGTAMVAATRVVGEYALTDYGPVDTTGVANSNAAWAACVAAWYAGGGGVIRLPAGRVLVTAQTVIPSGNPSANGAPRQPPLTIQGVGGHYSGQSTLGAGGTRLTLTYQQVTPGNSNDAQIVTYGVGVLTFRSVVLEDTVPNSETPFVYTTNTTIKTEGSCAFLGATGGVNCKKDVFILGGKIKPISTGYGDPDSAFQGYGTVITGNYFNNIRRPVYGRSYCNQTQFVFNMIDKGCGTNLAAGACIEFDGSLDRTTTNEGDYCLNNVVMGNYFHWVGGYTYIVKGKKASRTVVAFNGFIDPGANQTAGVRFEADTVNGTDYRSIENTVFANANYIATHLSEDALSAGRNTLISGGQGEATVLPGTIYLGSGASALKVGTPSASSAFSITDGTTAFLGLAQGAGGQWTMRGPLTLAGNASVTSTTQITIGNNSTAADAVINFNPPTGQSNQIQFKRAGTNSWLFYDAGSADFYFRDSVNSVMCLTLKPGAGVTGRVEVGGFLRVMGSKIEMASGGPQWLSGSGTPEASKTAPVGSIYTRTDGGAVTSFYVKESGAGNTGWVAK